MPHPESLEAFCRGALNEPDPGAPIGLYLAIALASIAVYVFVGGVVHRTVKENADGMIGGFWPFTGPWLLGMALVSFITKPRIPAARVVDRKDGGK